MQHQFHFTENLYWYAGVCTDEIYSVGFSFLLETPEAKKCKRRPVLGTKPIWIEYIHKKTFVPKTH
jgi:hypothetical protein